MSAHAVMPSREDLQRIFHQKYGEPAHAGWGPRTRHTFNYFTPDDYYEAAVANLVQAGAHWLDVGGGRDLLPGNEVLARELTARCQLLVAVDPSPTVEENRFAHQRVQMKIVDFTSTERFDLATLRMVAEHIDDPEPSIAALARLVKPKGLVVIYTINQWSPLSLISWVTPFWIHHPIKHLLWKTEEKDTFPVVYKMNSRKRLQNLFEQGGFREVQFAYLDDCRTFHRFRVLSTLELALCRMLHFAGASYPENCLLGIYQRQE